MGLIESFVMCMYVQCSLSFVCLPICSVVVSCNYVCHFSKYNIISLLSSVRLMSPFELVILVPFYLIGYRILCIYHEVCQFYLIVLYRKLCTFY